MAIADMMPASTVDRVLVGRMIHLGFKVARVLTIASAKTGGSMRLVRGWGKTVPGLYIIRTIYVCFLRDPVNYGQQMLDLIIPAVGEGGDASENDESALLTILKNIDTPTKHYI